MSTNFKTPPSINSICSLLNKHREESFVPPLPVFTKDDSNITQKSATSLSTKEMFPMNYWSQNKISVLKNPEIKAPKASYCSPSAFLNPTNSVGLEKNGSKVPKNAPNKDQSIPNKKRKIDYISLLAQVREKKDLSILSNWDGKGANINKNVDTPELVWNGNSKPHEISSTESESALECAQSTIGVVQHSY